MVKSYFRFRLLFFIAYFFVFDRVLFPRVGQAPDEAKFWTQIESILSMVVQQDSRCPAEVLRHFLHLILRTYRCFLYLLVHLEEGLSEIDSMRQRLQLLLKELIVFNKHEIQSLRFLLERLQHLCRGDLVTF